MLSRLDSNGPSTGVCPVTANAVRLSRGGRLLLNIPEISFGHEPASPRCTLVVGPNGAGKSVLVRIVCHLLQPDSGYVRWAGDRPSAVNRHRVGLMLQKPVLLRRSAQANLVYALRQAGHDRSNSQHLSLSAMEAAGLADIARVPAHGLSGGEQQRLALVRALLLKPDILFLDEPTANVDPSSTLVIEQQLGEAIRKGLHVVMVSHDQGQVKRLADEVVLMHKGQVVERATRQRFFDQPRNVLTQRWITGELLV
ncbi:MAG: ATP-binding cassette domain-containing protein [Granulosicoccus sp.]